MNSQEILEILKSGQNIAINQFNILQVIANEINNDRDSLLSKELVLRSLEHIKYFSDTKEILYSLVREIGLFPYLELEYLSLKDSIAYEYHRPYMLDSIVFHQEQLPIYLKIIEGKNIVLSAPTSFGKSKIVDALIAYGKFQNIVIVVPTLALIDETRRRLTKLFSSSYNIISHPSLTPSNNKNLFIFTPERVVAYKELFPKIDFFVVDEFYKIGGQSEDKRRIIALNEAFYFLYKKQNAQFYMLGPNIQTISDGAGKRFNFEFISTDYNTVITETLHVHSNDENDRYQKLINICQKLSEPTLIYCKSISQVYEVAEHLLKGKIYHNNSLCDIAADWLSKEFHPDWVLPRVLKAGIGLHYGPLPRSISQEMVRMFNDGKIQFLICTSTLIEGVNTKAKNVIIFENKIARQKLDYFTFNNIKGRSGRMFEHFIGRVFYFDDEPQQELPFVDFPLHTQDENTSECLLIQIEPEDLNKKSKKRVEELNDKSPLPISLLKENHGIEPDSQIEVYNEIIKNISTYHSLLSWNKIPKYEQLKKCCELIWKHWIVNSQNRVYSASQLALKIWKLKEKQTYVKRILSELEGNYAAENANEAVERILTFDRNWASYDFPQYLTALDRIQKYIFNSKKIKAGDYSYFSSQVETLFRPEHIIALDEFGIPVNISEKSAILNNTKSLDEAISILKKHDIDSMHLHPYEKIILNNAIDGF